MNILIVAYHFYPDITPRAFRAFELTKQFAKEGHNVTVLLPKSNFDYKSLCDQYSFSIIYTDYKKNINSQTIQIEKTSLPFYKKILRILFRNLMYCIFPSGRNLMFYFYTVYKKLVIDNGNYEIILSIATPYDNHIGVALALRKNSHLNSVNIKIADYGDPLYKNPALPNCILYYWIDKFIASKFDFITVPTTNAKLIYQKFKKNELVNVIPQGFDFSNTKLAKYSKNKIPTFGYAGMFYEKIRNPKPFLEYLLKINSKDVEFKFIIYTNTNNPNNLQLLEKYKIILKDKLLILSSVPRDEVIYELSKMDFLINFENISTSQAPSKLIDYALTKRPIYSFTQLNFSVNKFNKFLNGNFLQSTKVDLTKFDIKTISKKITELKTR